jgi:tRNA modification GTPase
LLKRDIKGIFKVYIKFVMIKELENDIIAAPATPAGFGALAVIRVSGKGCIDVLDKMFKGRSALKDAPGYSLHYGEIIAEGHVVDDVVLSVFRNPNSYTGEDSVEISCHGNPMIVKKILEVLLLSGVRGAEPGEFTKRAFLNNKLDLSQAEAVADVISSNTEASLNGARSQLNGMLSGKIKELKEQILNAASLLELELDFAEEDIEFIERTKLRELIENIDREITLLAASYSFGKIVKDGVNVAIVGSTNVGKSSLLNYILKESRAIVSDIPGTTRDIIQEDVNINGVYYKLYDTAGIRSSEDIIENEGINRSRAALKNADLVIVLLDASDVSGNKILDEVGSLLAGKKVIKVLNKSDLGILNPAEYDVLISAKTGEGINTLFGKMEESVFSKSFYSEKSLLINNARHYSCLIKADESLNRSLQAMEQNLSGEFVSADIQGAISHLNEIIGEVTSEDILNNIFSKFCIGK